jgi:Xaa-Pro aminopeptidase
MKNRIATSQAKLKDNQAILIFQDDAAIRSNDVQHLFHPNVDQYYLSGMKEPLLWLLILPTQSIVFSRECSEKNRLWEGKRLANRCIKEYSIDHWHPIEKINTLIPQYLENYQISEIYTNTDLNRIAPTVKQHDIKTLTHPMRLIKDSDEIKAIKKATSISANGHNFLMENVRNYHNELCLEGAFYQFICQHNTRDLAYPPIIASGINACTLHYQQNNDDLSQDHLILVDAGCEYLGYASDITRTFPKAGRFTTKQQAIYEAVLDAQHSCITMLKPGIKWSDVQSHAAGILTQHLIDLNYLSGTVNDHIAQQSYKKYFPHGIGHGVGLDVHDARFKELQTNMVVTIEPGIYIPQEKIGIRIEDMILITPDGCDVLSHEAVKSISDIEKLCKK